MEGQDHDREEVAQPNEGQDEHIADYNKEREKLLKNGANLSTPLLNLLFLISHLLLIRF